MWKVYSVQRMLNNAEDFTSTTKCSIESSITKVNICQTKNGIRHSPNAVVQIPSNLSQDCTSQFLLSLQPILPLGLLLYSENKYLKSIQDLNSYRVRVKVSNSKVAEKVGVELMKVWLRRQCARWFWLTLRKKEGEVDRVITME